MARDKGGKQVAVVPNTETTLKLARNLASRTLEAGIDIALRAGDFPHRNGHTAHRNGHVGGRDGRSAQGAAGRGLVAGIRGLGR